MANVLIIDDDMQLCQFLSQSVEKLGHNATVAHTIEEGYNLSLAKEFDLVLLDLQFPQGSGFDILPDLIRVPSLPEVIIITGSGVQGAELAFKYGAWDYVQKPFTFREIALNISRALLYRNEKVSARTPLTLKRLKIIGNSHSMNSCLESVAKASATDVSVLITGETGTGKELFARAIHENSKRAAQNFMVVDCGSIPETLAESLLFGHEKGAFTGADKQRKGLVEQVEGGTLFLDEVGELPFTIQKSFLRVLQEKKVRPIGAAKENLVDFRVVAATNRNLEQMVEEKTFREDLLFRIRAMHIHLPPLRDRGEDICDIAISNVQRLCQQYKIGIKGISPEFLEILKAHRWPGNVRELLNVLEHSIAAAGGDPTLIPKHIPYQYRAAAFKDDGSINMEGARQGIDLLEENEEIPDLSTHLDDTTKNYLNSILIKAKGDWKKASALSGLSKTKLYVLLKKYNLPRFKS